MSFDGVNFENLIFFLFFKFSLRKLQNLIKNDKISDDFMKVHYLLKRLILPLIKSNSNYRSYYTKSITVTLCFSYISSYQMNFQLKNSQKF